VITSDENPVQLRPVSRGPAGYRCLISALATALQVAIVACLRLLDWPLHKHPLLWCWVVALDVGLTFGVYGLCSARNWNERILAISLLCFQFLLLWILFLIGVATYSSTHGTVSFH
jgi:hypothetical protein